LISGENLHITIKQTLILPYTMKASHIIHQLFSSCYVTLSQCKLPMMESSRFYYYVTN